MERFHDLSSREKIMLIIMAVLIVLYITWQLLISPLNQFHNRAEQAQLKAQKDRAFVEQNITRLGGSVTAKGEEDFSRNGLVSASRAAGIERLSRIQPQPNGDLKVWMDNVSGPQLFSFLQRVEQEYATRVTGAQISRQDGTVVSAQISFSMPVDE